MTIHLQRRSVICTPATATPKYMTSHRCGADVGLVDLEDSVPVRYKDAARALAEQYFSPVGGSRSVLAIRINTPFGLEGMRDLVAVADYVHPPKVVLVPRVESAQHVELVAAALDRDDYRPEVYAIVETPRGITQLGDILGASRLDGIMFGAAGYAHAAGCAHRWTALLAVRSVVVTAAASRGIPAIDTPFFDTRDLSGLARECRSARALGFAGKMAIHPAQVPVINQAFTPTAAEIDTARALLAAAQDGELEAPADVVGPTPFFETARELLARYSAESGTAEPEERS